MGQTKCAPALLVHGGAGNKADYSDGCRDAVNAGMRSMELGGDALAGAIAAVVVMENDERFNAGTGAALGLDGGSIEMDASIMDTRGMLGMVAGVHHLKNPVLLAREVADSPHVFLVGEGAMRFARLCGFGDYENFTATAAKKHREILEKLCQPESAMAGVDNREFARLWNYAGKPRMTQASRPEAATAEVFPDTVGAVARDAAGHFAVASSTGGSAPSLLGRVGDTPAIGCGFYCGKLGAIAATGIGEYIIRHLLARTVYGWLEEGMPLDRALQRGIDLFAKEVPVGLIGVTRSDIASCTNREMPTAKA